jgi:hypothetical protein
MEWNGKENLSKRVREYKYSRKLRTPGQLNSRPNTYQQHACAVHVCPAATGHEGGPLLSVVGLGIVNASLLGQGK